MVQSSKTMAFLLVAIACLGAFGASAAMGQVQGKFAASGPATLTGEQTGTLLQNSLTTSLGSFTCPNATYVGHEYGSTPHAAIPLEATTVTITPNYGSGCKAHISVLGTRTVKVAMNGCDYVSHIGETTGGVESTYGVSFDVVCPEGKQIDLEVLNFAETNVICTIAIKGQTGLKGAHVKSTTTSDDLDIEGTLAGIHEEHSGSLCGEGTGSTAELHLDVTAKGKEPSEGVTVID